MQIFKHVNITKQKQYKIQISQSKNITKHKYYKTQISQNTNIIQIQICAKYTLKQKYSSPERQIKEIQINTLFSEYDGIPKPTKKADNEICAAADYKVSAIVKASAVNTIKMTSVGFQSNFLKNTTNHDLIKMLESNTTGLWKMWITIMTNCK